MPPYAYKVNINRKREKVHTECTHEFDARRLSIALLLPIVGDHPFSVHDDKYGGCTVCWMESRDETDAEYDARIARLEKYNAEVDRRKSKA